MANADRCICCGEIVPEGRALHISIPGVLLVGKGDILRLLTIRF